MEEPKVDGIEKSVGAFGRWHLCVCMILYTVKIPVAWHQMNIVLIAPPTNFTCIDKPDKCDKDCSGHEFDRSVFTETIITTWDLVCDKKYIPNLVQSSIMLGILLANLTIGFVADRFGRKYVCILAIIAQVITGCSAAFVPWLWVFMALKFMNAASTGCTMLTSFVLIMEITGLRWRTIVTSLFHIPFSLGHLLLAPVGYFIRDWHYIQLTCSLPTAILVLFVWVLPESPRWLLSVGKREKAIKELQKGAKCNHLPTEDIEKNADEYIAERELRGVTSKGGNIKDLFRTKNATTKFLMVLICWFNCGFSYFGVSQFIGRLKGDIFVNIAIAGSCGLPGMVVAAVLLQTVGRKPTLLISNTAACLGLLIMIPFVDSEWIAPILASLTIFGLSISFSTVYCYAGELFPTLIRNLALGICSMCARTGSMIAPHIFSLEEFFGTWLTPLIFGSVCFASVLASMFLPETKDCKLPDTVEDSENFKITLKFNKHDI